MTFLASFYRLKIINSALAVRTISNALWLASFVVLLTIGRWRFINYPVPMNPDEAQAAATAMRVIKHGWSWNSIDGTTAGPLHSLILCWPKLFGLDITLFTVRLTSAILFGIATFFVFKSIRLFVIRSFSLLAILPMLLLLSITNSWDLQHYSSENVPVMLIAICIWISVKLMTQTTMISNYHFFLLGTCSSLVSYAKLQATPIILVVVLYAILFTLKQDLPFSVKRSLAVSFGIGLSIPIVTFTAPLIFHSSLNDFWTSYIRWSFDYVQEPLSLQAILQLMTFDSAFVAFLVVLALIGLAYALTQHRLNWNRDIALFSGLVLLSSIFVIGRPGNLFPHYLHFLIVPATLLFGVVFSSASITTFLSRLFYVAAVLVTLFVFQINTFSFEVPTIGNQKKFQSSSVLDHLKVSDNPYMLVWGWMPQWYLTSGLIPATREAHTYAQITDTPLRNYFRNRLLADFKKSQPDIVIDAVTGGSFGFNDSATSGIETFPEFAQQIEEKYEAIKTSRTSDNCPTTYVKKENLRSIQSRQVEILDIFASSQYSDQYAPYKIDDWSVTEDTCTDYWLLPSNQNGWISFTFQESPLQEIWLLNTRNSNAVLFQTDQVRIEVLNDDGKQLFSESFHVNPYPDWTKITLPQAFVSSQVTLRVLEHSGDGAGFNEVKVFKSRQ